MVSSAVEGLDVGAGSARPWAIDDRPYEFYRYCTVKRNRAVPIGVANTDQPNTHWNTHCVRNPGIDDQSIPGFSRKER